MSISAGITIELYHGERTVSALDIIDVLSRSYWEISLDGKFTYLPLGDEKLPTWRFSEIMSKDEFFKILKEKERLDENIGLKMTWKKSIIGCFFVISDNFKISVSVGSDRQTVALKNDYEITDFHWYLEKLLPPLDREFGVEYFSCSQHR